MAFCSECGKKLDDAVKFCSGCGKAQNITNVINNNTQVLSSPTEEKSVDSKIIKQGPLAYSKGKLVPKNGNATLYNDKFDWIDPNGMTIVIRLADIVSTKTNNVTQNLTINLINNQKEVFTKALTGGDWAKQIAFGYLGSGSVIANIAEWKSAIDIARGSNTA